MFTFFSGSTGLKINFNNLILIFCITENKIMNKKKKKKHSIVIMKKYAYKLFL